MTKLKFILTPVALLLAFQVYADETLHADVVVVGAGAGGTIAAVSAVENGLKTVLLSHAPGNLRPKGRR